MIYIAIPTFNRKDSLLECLRCLSGQSVDVTAVISDSGSTDGTAEAVEREFPGTIRLEGNPDLWWTGATALGLSYIAGIAGENDHFLFLNDDTEFGPHYCAELLKCAERHPRSVVGSACVDRGEPEKLIDGGMRVNWCTAADRPVNRGRELSEFEHGHVERVSVLPGRGTLFPVSVLRDVGMLDVQRLPHYAADYEFARRCAKNGYDLLVCYDAVVESNTATTGLHKARSVWSLKSARDYFFGRASSCNLMTCFHYSYLTSRNPISGTVFFLFRCARLVKHYFAP